MTNMGDIVIGLCSCGFQSDDLYLGVGMMGGVDKTICYCSDCKKVQTEPSYNYPKICSDCEKDLVSYVSDEDELEIKSEGSRSEVKNYHCPSCRQESLLFHKCGLWD